MKNKGKILAIDLGQAHVGLAITDPGRVLVFGKGVIRNFKSLSNLFAKISIFCEKEQVSLVVFGLPLDENGNLTKQSERIQSIGKKLEHHLKSIPVDFVDESYTSYVAGHLLSQGGLKGSEQKTHEDEMAAILILERYLADKSP